MAGSASSDHEFDNDGKLILTGSANAYVAATARKIKGYYEGLRICGRANFTNTGAATITVDEAGSVAIRKKGNAALVGGEIINGGYYDFIYDEANAVMQVGTAAAQLPLSASGDRWGVIPFVETDGVMEIGRYIDFHNSDADTGDNANRLETNGGTVGLFETPSGGSLKRIVSLINSTLAQGDVIYFDGTNFVRLAPGTAGQFLRTAGAAANPAWAGVAVTPETQGTVTNQATLPITLGTANMYEIDLMNILPVDDSADLQVQFSQSGSFISSAGAYCWSNTTFAIRNNVEADTVMEVYDQQGNQAPEGAFITFRVFRPSVGSFHKAITWWGSYRSLTPETIANNGGGRLLANTNAIDGVRFLFDTGNIASGSYAVRSYSFT